MTAVTEREVIEVVTRVKSLEEAVRGVPESLARLERKIDIIHADCVRRTEYNQLQKDVDTAFSEIRSLKDGDIKDIKNSLNTLAIESASRRGSAAWTERAVWVIVSLAIAGYFGLN